MLSINRFITCTCEGETIPEMLLADLSLLEVGQRVTIDRVAFPPGVKPMEVREDFTLGVIRGKSSREAVKADSGGEKEEEED